MAAQPKVFKNPTIKIGTVDLTGWCTTATVRESMDKVNVTTFGASNTINIPSLGDATIECEFFTDYQSGGSNQTLRSFFTASKAGTAGSVEIIPENTTVSATNPRINMPAAHLYNFDGFIGSVTDASKFTATFENAGTAGITWGTV